MHYQSSTTSQAITRFFFFQAEDGIRDLTVTGVQTCALPISPVYRRRDARGRRQPPQRPAAPQHRLQDRKSTRLNSSHSQISYAVFCLKKKSTKSGRPNADRIDAAGGERKRALAIYAVVLRRL